MARGILFGTRIRERRTALKLKQADLASSVGISASYLNLIEHNKRKIGGKLLIALADALQTEPYALGLGQDASLIKNLEAAASEAQNSAVEIEQLEELLGRFPGWAACIDQQFRRIAELEDSIQSLNDRLSNDPIIAENMHEILSTASAIRSTASILVNTPELDREWQKRFHGNIDKDSRRLAENSQAMLAYFDRLTFSDETAKTPVELFQAFVDLRGYHFAELEVEGADDAIIDRMISPNQSLAAPEAEELARQRLRVYLNDARQLPISEFKAQCAALNFDPASIANHFGAPLERVFRRLASLPSENEMPNIGLFCCDTSGATTLRKLPTGYEADRSRENFPNWPLFAALAAPGQPVQGQLEVEGGAMFQAYAVSHLAGDFAFGENLPRAATMVVISG